MSETTVEVKVTDKNAIYINNTRVTDRGTKWGVHNIVDTLVVPKSDVVRALLDAGHAQAVKRIDDEPYLSQRAALSRTEASDHAR